MSQYKEQGWKLLLMPEEVAWWIWLITACMLAVGLSGYSWAFLVATGITVGQTIVFLLRYRSLMSSAVQTRVAYVVLLTICFIPGLRWLYWLPTIGTFALVICGYCLMARFLSLLPSNRTERISADLLRHTFLAPPTLIVTGQGLPMTGCPGGVCSIEAQLGRRSRTSVSSASPGA